MDETTTTVLDQAPLELIESSEPIVTPIEPILQDGLWVDPTTGEIVGVADGPDLGEPLYEKGAKGKAPGITEAFAEWILRKVRHHLARKKAAVLQRTRAEEALKGLVDNAVSRALESADGLEIRMEIEQAAKIEKRAGNAVTFFACFYREQLQEFALRKLGTSTKRTLDLLGGSISLRKGSSKLVVNDATLAAKYLLRKKAVDAVTYSVKTSAIPEKIVALIDKGKVPGIARVTEPDKCELKIDGEKI